MMRQPVRLLALASLLSVIALSCSGDHARQAATPLQGAETPAQQPLRQGQADVWVTTGDGRALLQQRKPIPFTPDNGRRRQFVVDVNPAKRYQTIEGFGATLTDSSAWLIQTKMSASQRDELLRKLFGPNTGIGLNVLRRTIGASDFSLENYTYDDMPPGERDPDLAHFSIEHDQAYVLPLFRQVLQIDSNLRVIATPWSPPAWMKTSDSLIGGSLRPDAYAAFARYLVRYIQAYHEEGIPLEAITPQNEPLFEPTTYPGMLMTAAQEAEFIRNDLGPAVTNAGLDTKIFIYDHNWDHADYPLTVLADAGARQYVQGTAFHCYAGHPSSQADVHDAYPDKSIVLSECTGLTGSDQTSDFVWWMQYLFIGSVREWASGVLFWNLALDENSGPHNGGCDNCRGVVTINEKTGDVTYNSEYYALAHATLAASVGASRIDSTTFAGRLSTVAFLNPDGSTGLLVLNPQSQEITFTVRESGQSFEYTLPAQSVATFKWH